MVSRASGHIRRIDAVVNLPTSLHADVALAGEVVRAKISGRWGKIFFPELPDDYAVARTNPAHLEAPKTGIGPLPEDSLAAVSSWGYVSADHAFIDALRARISIDDHKQHPPDAIRAFGRVFDQWFATARDWISAWSGQVENQPLPRESHIYARMRTQRGLGTFGSGVTLGAISPWEKAASREMVIAAFECASNVQRLPMSHQMLMRARVEAAARDYRRAVIDSCTAAEIALTDALRHMWRTAPEATLSNTLQKLSGVVELFRLFAVTGGEPSISEQRVMDQLARPRNDAAHAGQAGDHERATRAIETASILLQDADPLPSAAAMRTAMRRMRPAAR